MTTEEIVMQLNQLKLSGMVIALHEQEEKPAMQSLTFIERLSMLVDRELIVRNNRRVAKLLKQAKLRQQACVEDIDYHHPRKLNKDQFMILVGCEFITKKHNIIITGFTGCGKSFLACALGNQACRLGFGVQYLKVPRFLEELAISHADGSYGKLLVQLAKKDLIILDDFGMAPALTAQQYRDLFNIIDDRHQLKSTLITSQLPIKNWHDYISEPTTADAILERLLQSAYRIELKGPSMRKNEILN